MLEGREKDPINAFSNGKNVDTYICLKYFSIFFFSPPIFLSKDLINCTNKIYKENNPNYQLIFPQQQKYKNIPLNKIRLNKTGKLRSIG